MLFELVNCNSADYECDEQKQLALSNILRTHGLKKNIVISDRKTLVDILASKVFSRIDKTYAEDILNTRREHGNLKKKLILHAVIDFQYNGISCNTADNRTAIRVGYNFFIDPDKAGAVSLLTENGQDFRFYNKMAEFYSEHISELNLKVKFKERLGAGSHSKPEFDRITSENEILLCLVDSDKKHPKSAEGSTSRKFTINDRKVTGLSLAKVLDVREIESLIPTAIIEKIIIPSISGKIDTLDEIKKHNENKPLFRSYFDHKEGLTLKSAIELDTKHGGFWVDILSINDRFSSKKCLNSGSCDDCKMCPKIDGFGDSLLRNSVIELEKFNLRKLRLNLDEYLKPHWTEIGELLVGWGCAGNGGVVRS